MKKIVVFILIVLSFSMIFTQVSCANNSQEPESTSNVVLLSGFDDFKELRTFKFNETFGIAEIIDDAKYVTEGSRAAKFTVDGGYVGIPEVSVFTNTPYCSEKDFSKVQALSVDMYNTDTKVHTVEISFTTRNGAVDRTSYPGKTFNLNPGANSILFELDRSMAAAVCYIDKVEYITFRFDNSHEVPYVVYVDNLQAYLTEEPVEKLVKSYKEDEILFFDDKIDRAFAKATTIRAVQNEAGEISLNRNKKYISSGNGSLKCTVAVNPSTNPNNAPAITISGQPVERINFSEYSKIQFKVMCDKTLAGNMNFAIEIYDVNENFLNSIDHLRNYIPWGEPIPGNTWFTLEVDLNMLADHGLNLEKLSRFNFYYGTPSSGEPYSWYVDDLKVVK